MSDSKPIASSDSKRNEATRRLSIEGQSPSMQRLRNALARVAPFPTAVLLTGETGTGKGTVARALHDASPRCHEPFVHVDCAGLVDGLLESELYGVAKGAFTGAQYSRAGRFETALEGTLFLDEVGELSPAGQIKLLRVLEEGTFERVGETRTRCLSARVVAATHVDLESAVRHGRFRTDLYFRLRVLRLEVPPLREQTEDLPMWIRLAADRAAERLACAPPVFSAHALDRLRNHDWPGNLRELMHVVEAAAVLSGGRRIEAELVEEVLAPIGRGSCGRSQDATVESKAVPMQDERSQHTTAERAVERANGNLSLAARRLGIPRSTLRYRLGLDDSISRGRRLRAVRSIRDGSQRE